MFGTGYQSNFPVRFLDAGRLLHSAQQGIYNPLLTESFVRKTIKNVTLEKGKLFLKRKLLN